MTVDAVLQLALYVVLLIAVTPLLGGYMAKVFIGERVWLTPVLRPIERGLYRLCGVKADEEQHWTTFTFSLLAFNLLGFLLLYAILRLQSWLPLNPADMGPVSEHLAFNTAVSFVTNTNWQSYGGESTLSYLSQMLGLTVQNFVSAATGIAVALALIRGFARRSMGTVGNFWVDMVRATLYVLLPLVDRRRAVSGLAGHAADLRAVRHRDDAGRARSRSSPRVRWRARSPSRCWDRTAAASSTSTRRIPTRTRPRSPTWSRRCSS